MRKQRMLKITVKFKTFLRINNEFNLNETKARAPFFCSAFVFAIVMDKYIYVAQYEILFFCHFPLDLFLFCLDLS